MSIESAHSNGKNMQNHNCDQLQPQILWDNKKYNYSFNRALYTSFGFIRIYFEKKYGIKFTDTLKFMIHRYSLINKNNKMIEFQAGIIWHRLNLVKYAMQDSGYIHYDQKNNIFNIHCYGDMKLNRSSMIKIMRMEHSPNGEFHKINLKITARNIYLSQGSVITAGITTVGQIDILCYSLCLGDGSHITSKGKYGSKMNINIVNNLIFGRDTYIAADGIININIGGRINGYDTFKINTDQSCGYLFQNADNNNFDNNNNNGHDIHDDDNKQPSVIFNCNDFKDNTSWNIEFNCAGGFGYNSKTVQLNNKIFKGCKFIWSNNYGHKQLEIFDGCQWMDHPNVDVQNVDIATIINS